MKGYRTILFNVGIAALAIVDLLINDGDALRAVFGTPTRAASALVALKVANIVLRLLTTTPVGEQA